MLTKRFKQTKQQILSKFREKTSNFSGFDFDNEVYYSESFCLSHNVFDGKLPCMECGHVTKKPKHGDKWFCQSCGIPFSSHGNGITAFSPLKKIQKIGHDKITIVSRFQENKVNEKDYTEEKILSDHCIDKTMPSQILSNVTYEFELFKCPCCKIEYSTPDHGSAWICSCGSEYLTYGNYLAHKKNEILAVQKKLQNF